MRPRADRQILCRLSEGTLSWSRLVDGQDGSLGEFEAALRRLAGGGLIDMADGRCALTTAGRGEVSGAWSAPRVDPACAPCEGTGYAPADGRLADRLTAWLEGRPGPNLDYDQGAITPA